MRRLLLFLLLLLPAGADEPKATLTDRGLTTVALKLGNYRLGEKLLTLLPASPDNDVWKVSLLLEKGEAGAVLDGAPALVQKLREGKRPDLELDVRLLEAWAARSLAQHERERAALAAAAGLEVTETYPAAIMARCVVKTLQTEQEWLRNPAQPLEALLARYDEAWKPVQAMQLKPDEYWQVFSFRGLARAASVWGDLRAHHEPNATGWLQREQPGRLGMQVLLKSEFDAVGVSELYFAVMGSLLDVLEDYTRSELLNLAHERLIELPMMAAFGGANGELLKTRGYTVDPRMGDTVLLLGRYFQLDARFKLALARREGQVPNGPEILKALDTSELLLKEADNPGPLRDLRWDRLQYLAQVRPAGWDADTERLATEAVAGPSRPGIVLAHCYLGALRAEQKRVPEAIELLKKGLSLHEELIREVGGNEAAAAELRRPLKSSYDLLTRLLLDTGKPEEAWKVADQGTRMVASGRADFYRLARQLKGARALDLPRLQATLPAATAVLQLFPEDDKLSLFLATQRGVTMREVPVRRSVLEDGVRSLRTAIQKRGDVRQLGEGLYASLLAPVAAELKGCKLLVIVPAGELHYLPFAALSHAGRYVVEDFAVVVEPRASDLSFLGAPPPPARGRLVAFANPDGSLPAAEAEAATLAGLFGGSQVYKGKAATEARLRSAARGARFLHLATHGVLNPRDAFASYLVLADDSLAVNEIAELELGPVELVTLSACQTALGERSPAPGSEVTSLADAFAYAGGRALLASQWSVADASTKALMEEFYGGLKAGKSKALALQAAQLKLLRGKFAAPFYWAPFVLLGDWR